MVNPAYRNAAGQQRRPVLAEKEIIYYQRYAAYNRGAQGRNAERFGKYIDRGFIVNT